MPGKRLLRQLGMATIALALWAVLWSPALLAQEPSGRQAGKQGTQGNSLPGHPCLSAGDNGPTFSQADLAGLYRRRQVAHMPLTHAPSLTESEAGHAFSLADLRLYMPPKPVPPVVPHPPLFTRQYPAQLQEIPRPARAFSAETMDYLAQHEIRGGEPGSNYVALTFDCELYPQHTMRILQTLREEGVHATFFVLGQFAYNFPAVLQQMAADGHEIGNHSFFHPYFTEISNLQATNEITYTEAAVSWAVGQWVPMRYFRFPGAYRDLDARRMVASLGYQSVGWTVDAQEWAPGKTDEAVLAIIQRQMRSGGIVLLHCREIGARVLPSVIQLIRDRGLTPGTVTDVLKKEDLEVPGYPVTSSP